MHVKTLLNHVYPHKGFIYEEVNVDFDKKEMEISIRPRKNSRATCSGCGQKRPGYDRLDERKFEFIPLWGFVVLFLYAMRRVDCPQCGVTVEKVPWACGKHPFTIAYSWFIAHWSRYLSWQEVARIFKTSWHIVYHSVQHAVQWGEENRSLENIQIIGIDEIHWSKKNEKSKYLTLVYQIDNGLKRLLWVGDNRTAKCLKGFFEMLGEERSKKIRFICSDIWKAYLKAVQKYAGHAVHVLDRFHIMQHFNKAIDNTRREEVRKLKREGKQPVLKNSRWLLLKNKANLNPIQSWKLRELLQCNLKTVRCYLLREDFQHFWTYWSATWANKFLEQWCTRTMRSKIEPMKNVAKMLRRHKPLILNYFRANRQISNGVVEGFNTKAKLISKKAYGYKDFDTLKTALLHNMGDLPMHQLAHRFFN